jgi:rRNA maturation endonuclease Nob1
MTLTVRKTIVLGLIGVIFLMANILVVANWIDDSGIAEKAGWVRREFLTGTAVAVILVLLILLINPKASSSRAVAFSQRCPVCDKRLIGNTNYCGECGSKVQS